MSSRRSFLKGVSGFALGSVALTAKASPVVVPRNFDASYDVIVVGAGAAGLSAAHNALDKGLSVLLLEKLPFIGGSSAICGGQWAMSDTPYQKKMGVTDSDELFLKDMLKQGQEMNDPELVRTFIRYSKSEFDWVTAHGVEPWQVRINAGMSVPRSHFFKAADIIKMMSDYVKTHGGEILVGHKAERLLWDHQNECIAGVRVSSKSGTKFIQARKGVILTAGGFSNNPAMLKKYAPALSKAIVIASAGTEGDGILMAQAYGADVLDTNFIKGTYGFTTTARTAKQKSSAYYAGAILVNVDGKRFVNESLSYKLLGDEALSQKEGISFIFFDNTVRLAAMKMDKRDKSFWETIDKDGTTKYGYVGQTIEEVATKAGIDPQALVATVKDYNDHALAGKDKFGRRSLSSGFGELLPLKEPPYVAMPATAAMIGTYCGVKINTRAEVIDVFGEAIPHLYAAGEMVGGVHGASYMSGTALAKAYGLGRLAAESVAKN